MIQRISKGQASRPKPLFRSVRLAGYWTNYDRATEPEKWERGLCDIKRGNYAEDAWNAWLGDHGFPTLVQIGLGNGPDGWAVPFRTPSCVDGDKIETSLSLKWARILSLKAKDREHV